MIGKKRYDFIESIIKNYNQFLQTKLFREDVLEKCMNEFMEINKAEIQHGATKEFLKRMQNIGKQGKQKKR